MIGSFLLYGLIYIGYGIKKQPFCYEFSSLSCLVFYIGRCV